MKWSNYKMFVNFISVCFFLQFLFSIVGRDFHPFFINALSPFTLQGLQSRNDCCRFEVDLTAGRVKHYLSVCWCIIQRFHFWGFLLLGEQK